MLSAPPHERVMIQSRVFRVQSVLVFPKQKDRADLDDSLSGDFSIGWNVRNIGRPLQQRVFRKIVTELDTKNTSPFARDVTNNAACAIQVVGCLDADCRHQAWSEAPRLG